MPQLSRYMCISHTHTNRVRCWVSSLGHVTLPPHEFLDSFTFMIGLLLRPLQRNLQHQAQQTHQVLLQSLTLWRLWPNQWPQHVAGTRRHMWGVFLMTRLPASSSSRGGWQATCPYHRKSQVTACRKACMAIDTSQEASHRVLRQLKFWCLQAPIFDRQRAHMLLDPRLETALPPDEVLDAQVPTVAPQGVLMDEQLDAQGPAPPP